ncbi:NAD(P)H-hydrate dehydratase [Clostridium sp. DL1XJH146]
MRVADAKTIKTIDNYCIDNIGIPGIVLMENAAIKILENIDKEKFHKFVIVCGVGNNGGDGLVLARHLELLNKKIDVFIVGNLVKMSDDCNINYQIIRNLNVEIQYLNNNTDLDIFREAIKDSQCVIDSIFGTGLSRELQGIYDKIVSVININSKYTISVDIPSGLDSDTGEVQGNCIEADKTITFQLYKKGFLKYGVEKYTGKVIVENIGIPDFVFDKFHKDEFLVDTGYIKDKIKVRKKYYHKGKFGKVAIFAGMQGYTGAAYICTHAAVRTGSGLVTLCCPSNIRDILSSKFLEAMTLSYEQKNEIENLLNGIDAVAIGPGMGNSDFTKQLLSKIVKKLNCPLVIDADALNVLENDTDLLRNNKSQMIITPHPGEMARLTGKTINDINNNRIEIAKDFSKEYGTIVVLKGYNTIITDGNKVFVNTTGNSSMASGGMGDCLTGIITSLVGQGYEPFQAAIIAVYLHGYCGEKLSKTMHSVNAKHILEEIPFAMKDLEK